LAFISVIIFWFLIYSIFADLNIINDLPIPAML